MAEEKSSYQNKGLPAQLVTLTVGGSLVRQITIDNADSIDIDLTITQHRETPAA